MSKNYTPKELVGIKIAHDFEDFIDDQEIVLTLADKPILSGIEKIDEETDILENQQMKDKFTTEFYNTMKTKKSANNNFEDRYETEKKLLPQYDEKKPEKKGIVLDENGTFDLNKMNRLDMIKKKLKTANDNSISLNMEKKIAAEYAASQPFPKPMKKKKVKKDEDLINFLEESAENNDYANYGSRETKKNESIQQHLKEEQSKREKIENYNAALDKAQAQTDMTHKRKGLDFSSFMDDEEEQLQRSLMKQQKFIQEKSNVEETVKSLIETNSKIEEKYNKNNQEDFSIAFDIKRSKDDKIKKEEISSIVTSTEFLKNVKTEQELYENQQKIIAPEKFSIKDSKEGITSVVNVPLPSERLINYNKTSGFQSISKPQPTLVPIKEKKAEADDEYDESYLEKNEEELKKELQFLDDEPYGNGLAGVLKRLRERGELRMNDDDYSGRTNDKLPHEELAKFGSAPSDKIKLEYRDNNGKLMTQKEAFRYMCWTFHGKKPGKRKMEKKMRKEQMKTNPKIKNIGETPLMKAFTKVQAKSNQPYMVLSQMKND